MGVVQRHALTLEDLGSEISLKSQSRVAVNGLSMGPNKTLVGKHSLKTAKKHNEYNMPVIHLIFFIMERFNTYQYLYIINIYGDFLFENSIDKLWEITLRDLIPLGNYLFTVCLNHQ